MRPRRYSSATIVAARVLTWFHSGRGQMARKRYSIEQIIGKLRDDVGVVNTTKCGRMATGLSGADARGRWWHSAQLSDRSPPFDRGLV
jgi:hypothetical protein